MTAIGGGPALDGAATAGAGAGTRDHAGAGAATPAAPRLRTMLSLAWVEAVLLVRSRLVLAGLLAGGFAMWLYFRQAQWVWWDAAWRIGWGQLILGVTVLAAAQLAAGRARRDGLTELYASFPATAATRTLAQLAGLVGVLPASLLLAGAVTAALQAALAAIVALAVTIGRRQARGWLMAAGAAAAAVICLAGALQLRPSPPPT